MRQDRSAFDDETWAGGTPDEDEPAAPPQGYARVVAELTSLTDEVARLEKLLLATPALLAACKALPLECNFTDSADFKDNAGAFVRAMDLARVAISSIETPHEGMIIGD